MYFKGEYNEENLKHTNPSPSAKKQTPPSATRPDPKHADFHENTSNSESIDSKSDSEMSDTSIPNHINQSNPPISPPPNKTNNKIKPTAGITKEYFERRARQKHSI